MPCSLPLFLPLFGGGELALEARLPMLLDLQRNHLVDLRITDRAVGLFALSHALDLLAQEIAPHDDAAIGRAEQLLAAIEDRALRLPGHQILLRKIGEIVFAVGRA